MNGSMVVEDGAASDFVETSIWGIIRQAGPAGIHFRQVVAQTGLASELVVHGLFALYVRGDVQCFMDVEDLRFVAR
jgi:hypothetical protein